MIQMYCVISGEVQNVAYRVYAQDAASELGVVGWVKNMSDGTVAVTAQGEPDLLKEFVEYLHEGSLQAKIEAVAIDWQSVKTAYDDFAIHYD